MTYFVLILVSYFLGCLSTIVILIGLYLRFGLYPSGSVVKAEQYQTFHPINENYHSKNSTVDTVNYILQFLFQEIKDTSKLRRYILKKLNHEVDDFKQTKLGKLFLEDISIESFSLGKECPVFSDIQLERQERDKHKLIKEVSARLIFDYKDGFSVTLDIKLKFGYKCQLYIKIKRIRGHLRLEFQREPYSHWLAVFQDEPTIDFELKSYFSTRESPPLAQIILQQIRRNIRQKQTWPSYKIRYEPFFTRSKTFEYPNKSISGQFDVSLIGCDRLSIPFELFSSRRNLSLFLTLSINERTCQDEFSFQRHQWIRKTIDFIPKIHRISMKEISYMNRMEILIENFDELPDVIRNSNEFQDELADGKVFFLHIGNKEMKTIKQIQQYLHENQDRNVRIDVGIPFLNCIQVQQQVQFDDETSIMNTKNSSGEKIPFMMMNKDLFDRFQMEVIETKESENFIKFNPKPEKRFQVSENQRFLNICLWCEPPSLCTVPNINQKRVLLGYTSVTLSEIVSDALMSLHHETQMTLNFQSIHFDNRLLSEKITELSTHKGFDENLTHGFVTVNIKHQSDISNQGETKDQNSQSETDDTDEYADINNETDESSSKPTDHIFGDRQFQSKTTCGCCGHKIWMKTGVQCQNCSINVHKKCAEKLNQKTKCTHQTVSSNLSIIENENENTIDESNTQEQKTKRRMTTSKIADVASSAYSKLRELKPKRSTNPDNRKSLDLTIPNISETDLQDIITVISLRNKCLSEDDLDIQTLDEFFREKAVDSTEIYARAHQFAHQLLEGLTSEECRMKIEAEILRLKEEIDLQNQIRDETILEHNSNISEENTKKNIEEKLMNIDEKIQALGSLAIFYCSCLRYCHSDNDNRQFLDSI